MKTLILSAGALACAAMAAPVLANEVVVTPTSGGWTSPAGENSAGAFATITDTAAHSGNGSLEMFGDRTRFTMGALYPTSGSDVIASLSDVLSLTFDWMIATDSVSNLNPDYTPALRLNIYDAGSGTRKDLIWEGAYNGIYGPQTNPGTWYTTGANDKFYISGGNENAGMTLAQWASTLAQGSFVAGITVATGSSAGNNYHVFADNVTFTTTGGSTTYNFETDGMTGGGAGGTARVADAA